MKWGAGDPLPSCGSQPASLLWVGCCGRRWLGRPRRAQRGAAFRREPTLWGFAAGEDRAATSSSTARSRAVRGPCEVGPVLHRRDAPLPHGRFRAPEGVGRGTQVPCSGDSGACPNLLAQCVERLVPAEGNTIRPIREGVAARRALMVALPVVDPCCRPPSDGQEYGRLTFASARLHAQGWITWWRRRPCIRR